MTLITEDAEIISEEKNDPLKKEFQDLISELKNPTEHKTPGSGTGTGNNKSYSTDWDEEFESLKEEEEHEDREPEEKKQPGATAPGPKTDKLSEHEINSSAENAADMFLFTKQILLLPLVNWKSKRKMKKMFDDEQIMLYHKKLYKAADSSVKDDNEKRIKNIMDEILEKRDEKIKSIKGTEQDVKKLRKAFYSHVNFTQKPIPPIWLVIMACTENLGMSCMDVFLDD